MRLEVDLYFYDKFMDQIQIHIFTDRSENPEQLIVSKGQ